MLLKEYPEDDDEDPDDDQKSATKDKNDIENIQDNEFGGYNDDNCSSHQRTVLPNSPVAEKMSSTQKLKHSKSDKKTKNNTSGSPEASQKTMSSTVLTGYARQPGKNNLY